MQFELLAKVPGVRHTISEKDSSAPCDYSLALHTGQSVSDIVTNRQRLAGIFEQAKAYISVLQIHSDQVYKIDEAYDVGWQAKSDAIQADALITNLPEVVLTVLTADCVPILLFDPVLRAVGTVHAGWRGTEQRIVAKTVEAMVHEYGSDPARLLAGIGPAIDACCYEAGEDVARHFSNYPAHCLADTNGKYRLNLKAINREQLLRAGLKDSHIEMSTLCTSCSNERFFSYRKEQGCSGRFMSAIMVQSACL